MSDKKTSIAEQALNDMDSIRASIVENGKNIVSNLIREGFKEKVKAEINEAKADEDEEDNAQNLDSTNSDAQKNGPEEKEEAGEVSEPEEGAEESGEEGDNEWGEFEEYKVGNNSYDLTGVKDDAKVVRAYKLLTDNDNVVVKKDGDSVKIQDGDTGAEYVIEIDEDEETGLDGEPVEEGCIKEGEDDPAGIPARENEIEIQWDRKGPRNESKTARKPMREGKEMIIEVDLGYTDNYQDKDPIQGLNNNEPSKSARSWHKGVPTGVEKPWAGNAKSKGEPFGKDVKEGIEDEEDPIEEATNVGGFVQQNTTSKSHIPNTKGRKARNASVAGEKVSGTVDPRYKSEGVSEHRERLAKAIRENRELKRAVVKIKDALQEALLVNVNLGQFVRLVTENATSQEEKVDILNRFNNEAKTVEDSKRLYESISRSLKKADNINEVAQKSQQVMSVNETKAHETPIYQSAEMMNILDLMNRVEGC